MKRGAEMAIADINAAGGVNGRPIELDVTEKRRIEAGLELHDRYLSTLGELTSDGYFHRDLDGKLTFANRGYLDITGLTPQALSLDDLRQCMHPDDRPRLNQWRTDYPHGAGRVEENDALTHDVGPEVSPAVQLLVHVFQTVHDKAHRRADQGLARHQLVLGVMPELAVGQILMIDNDQQIEIREVASDRIMDPIAARIRSVEDDLEDLAVLQPLGPTGRDGFGERLADHLDHPAQFHLLARRQMIDRSLHDASLAQRVHRGKARSLSSGSGGSGFRPGR